jgi:vanillate/3-O-methylgallate O-demethylase
VEVRRHNMARFDHDFPGRAALEAEVAAPRRSTVTLRWNPEDVLNIYASGE